MEKPPFDELRQLAERHPAAFEALRNELVEDLIRRTPPSRQRRLRGLQFAIDARRKTASNPTKALIEIQSMMHDSLARLNRALRRFPASAEMAPQAIPNNVIPLFQASDR